ncbi:MAG: hypothetical protein Greene041614_260, partial [Parcubacteria group bacterium Greene0416_14]
TSTFAGLTVSTGGLTVKTFTSASCDLKSDTSGNVTCGTDANSGGTPSGFTQSGSTVALTTFTDNLGVGTSSPDVRSVATIAATSTTANILTLRTPGTINGTLYSGTPFLIQNISSTTLFSIDALGRIEGFVSSASSTVNGTFLVQNVLQASSTLLVGGTGTSTFAGDINTTRIGGTTATSTFAGLTVSTGGLRVATFTSASCDLKSDTSGNITCGTDAGGSTTPGGSDTQIQYNDGGTTFGGASLLVYDDTNIRFGVGTTTPWQRFSVGSDAAFDSNTIYFASSSAASLTLDYRAAATSTIRTLVNAFSIATSTTALSLLSFDGVNGRVAVGTTSPFAKFSVYANNGETNTTIFAVGSSSPTVDRTLFSVARDGLTTVGDPSNTGDAVLQYADDNNAWSVGYNSSDKSYRVASSTLLTTNVAFTITKGSQLRVGIATTAPGVAFSVDGDLLTGFTGVATTNGVCHNGADLDSALTAGFGRTLVVCSAAPGDIAEWYETEALVEEGDIVMPTIRTITYTSDGVHALSGTLEGKAVHTVSVLAKATSSDKIFGIVSTDPYQTFGKGIIASSTNPQPISLVGRVPVKMNGEGGAIRPGDRITLSSIPGVGTKATTSGMTVGIALESFDPASATSTYGTAKINVFMNIGFGHIGKKDVLNLTEQALQDLDVKLSLLASTTASSTPQSASFVAGFFDNLFARISAWFADTLNGIGNMFAQSFHAKDEICIDDQCLDKNDVRALLELVNTTTNTPAEPVAPTVSLPTSTIPASNVIVEPVTVNDLLSQEPIATTSSDVVTGTTSTTTGSTISIDAPPIVIDDPTLPITPTEQAPNSSNPSTVETVSSTTITDTQILETVQEWQPVQEPPIVEEPQP